MTANLAAPSLDRWAISAVYIAAIQPLKDESAHWQDAGLCAQTDPEAFFPEKGGSTREAKQTCRACPVRAECLEYALDHDEAFGVWGGMSERERRRLKRQARAATAGLAMAS